MTAKVKTSYQVTNWREYNESLVRCGDITFWFDEDMIDAWEHDNDEPKIGRPFTYSDTAIECLLVLRELFRLPCRQTEGLGRALVQLMRKSWKASVDYHRRSLAETAMHRMKGCFGSLLKNREFPHQRTEARLRSRILHHFAHLGLPQFEWS